MESSVNKSIALSPFHLAIPVTELAKAEDFYGALLQCSKGRSSNQWIDWNFFGHQLVTHLVNKMPGEAQYNQVDQKAVPVPHFGVVLSISEWQALAARLKQQATEFVISPCVRFAGEVGEQSTMFLYDPFGNALEFKAFKDMEQLFAN